MKIFLNFLLWVLSILSILISICAIGNNETLLLGIWFLILGLSLIPKIREIINQNFKILLEKLANKFNTSKYNNYIFKLLGLQWLLNKENIDMKIGILKVIIFILAFGLVVENMPEQPSTVIENSSEVQTNQNQFHNNKNVEQISKTMNINKIEASNIYKILINCGVNEIHWIEKIENIENAYFIHLENIVEPVKISLKNNEAEYILYGTWTLYNNGKYEGNLSDYSVTIDENMLLRKITKENINANLKYAQISKYNENSWNITRLNNDYNISCSIDTKNNFGMIVPHQFFLTYKKENGNFILDSMKCDEKYLIEPNNIVPKLTTEDKKSIDEINKSLGL